MKTQKLRDPKTSERGTIRDGVSAKVAVTTADKDGATWPEDETTLGRRVVDLLGPSTIRWAVRTLDDLCLTGCNTPSAEGLRVTAALVLNLRAELGNLMKGKAYKVGPSILDPDSAPVRAVLKALGHSKA